MKKEMEISMMERLQLLPLFQGMSNNDMIWIMEKLRFDFSKVPSGNYIVRQDYPCDSLIFILTGSVIMETENPNGTYCFQEKLLAPTVLQPEVLFGPQTNYTHSFFATSDTSILKVTKKEFWSYLIQDEVFRLNYINTLSSKAQNAQKTILQTEGGTLEQRIIRFILKLCVKPSGEKILKIKMEDFAFEMNETRINVSKVLNSLQQRQLINLKRSVIEIPHMEKLYQCL